GVTAQGGIVAVTPPREYFDDVFKIQVRDFGGKAIWKQRFTVPADTEVSISGSYSYQLCLDDGMCINPFPRDFSITIPAAAPSVAKPVKTKKTELLDTTHVNTTTNAIQEDIT